MFCSFQLRKITWNSTVHERLLGFIELSLNTAQAIKWCPTNEQRVRDQPLRWSLWDSPSVWWRTRLRASQRVTVSCKPRAVSDLVGRYFSVEERLWQASVRPARLHHPLEPTGRRLSHSICQTVNWTLFRLGSHKGRQTNMCMLTETMRGKLRVERRRVLNHNPNTGSYWVVSNGTALRESRKNIDLLKCEMCLAQRRATTAARLLKESISVNKRNKLLTHKGLSARLTAKGWQQKVGVKRRKREKTNNVKMLEHALSGWA